MAGEVDITLKTKYDGTGVDAAKAGIGLAAGNAEKLSQSSEQAAGSISAIGSAISFVNPQIGGMIQGAAALTTGIKGVGLALKALLTNPIALGIAAIAGAFLLIKKAVDSSREAMERIYSLAQETSARTIARVNDEIAKSFKKVGDEIGNATDKMRHFAEVGKMQKDNANALGAAERSLEKSRRLAGAADESERQDIIDEYALKEADYSAAAKKAAIRAEADAEWNPTLAEGNAKTKASLEAAALDNIEAVAAAKTMLNRTKKQSVRLAFSGVGEDDKRMRRLNDDEEKYQQQLNEQLRRQAEIESRLEQAKREEQQAIERRNAILGRLAVVDKELEAEQAALRSEIKKRKDDAAAAAAREEEENRQRYQEEWLRNAEAGKEELDELQNSRAGLSAKLGPVGALKATDRIASLGGFSTAAAAAVTGVGVQQKNPEIVKITSQIDKVIEALKDLGVDVKNSGSRWS